MTEKPNPYPKTWFQMYVEERQKRRELETKLAKAQDGYKEWRNALKGWRFNEFVELMDEILGGESTPKKEEP